jgi:hypothetical protein
VLLDHIVDAARSSFLLCCSRSLLLSLQLALAGSFAVGD